jgi:glycosyltransferase involved in cell wall biosynthesis
MSLPGKMRVLGDRGSRLLNRGRVHFVYPRPRKEERLKVERGEAPNNRMYGFDAVEAAGFEAGFSDRRFEQRVYRSFNRWFRLAGYNYLDPETYRNAYSCDAVVLKDSMSLSFVRFCDRIGVPCIGVDCFGQVHPWRLGALRAAVRLVEVALVFSATQARIWQRALGVGEDRVQVIRFGVDAQFFEPSGEVCERERRFAIYVGGDDRKDFTTVFEAARLSGERLVAVFPSKKMVPLWCADQSSIEFRYGVTYGELRDLYNAASYAVVAVQPGTHYPAGLTSCVEAITMAKPLICTSSAHLREYVRASPACVVVPARDRFELARAMQQVGRDAISLRESARGYRGRFVRSFNSTAMGESIVAAIERATRSRVVGQRCRAQTRSGESPC